MKTHTGSKGYRCTICSKAFHRDTNRRRHEELHAQRQQPTAAASSQVSPVVTPPTSAAPPPPPTVVHVRGGGTAVPAVPGPSGRRATPSPATRSTQRQRRHQRGQGMSVMKMSTAFRGACVSWRLSYPVSGAVGRGSDGTRVQELLVESTDTMREYLERYQRARRPIKFNMSLHIEFVQATDDTIVTSPPVVLVTPQHEVYAATDINSVLSDCVKQLDDRIVEFEGNGSGWVVNRLLLLDTTAWRLDPLRGRSSHDLPEWIRNTHCVINPQNADN